MSQTQLDAYFGCSPLLLTAFRNLSHSCSSYWFNGGCVCLPGKGCVGLIKEPLLCSLYGAFHCSSVESKRGLVPGWQAQAPLHGLATSASMAGLSGDPMSRLPEREVVSAGRSLSFAVKSVGGNVSLCRWPSVLTRIWKLGNLWKWGSASGLHCSQWGSRNTNACVCLQRGVWNLLILLRI